MTPDSLRSIDLVIPEKDWSQKRDDVTKYQVDVVVMGSDWEGDERFESLRDLCDVKFHSRTAGISTSKIKQNLGI